MEAKLYEYGIDKVRYHGGDYIYWQIVHNSKNIYTSFAEEVNVVFKNKNQ